MATLTDAISSYQTAAIAAAADTANQSLVSAPGAGLAIWVFGYHGTADVAGSIQFQDEDDTALTGDMPVAANGGFVVAVGDLPVMILAENKALEIDTTTCAFNGVLTYALVKV